MKERTLVSLVGLVVVALVAAGPAADPAPVRTEAHFLYMALLKAQTRLDRIRADIEKAGGELRTNAQAIREADGRLTVAMETQNPVAEEAPRRDLERERAERRKIKKDLSDLASDEARTENIYATVKAALAADGDRGPSPLPYGLVSTSAGDPEITKADGRKISAARSVEPRFLDAGDTVSTGGKGRVEILTLDGRASVNVEERSQVRLEGSSSRERQIMLLKGRIQVAVDKPAELERQLQDRLRGPEDELSGLLRGYRGLSGEDFARLFGSDFVLKLPGAVCTAAAAQFSADYRPDGTTEIQVQDGSVEVRGLSSPTGLTVAQGSAVTVTKEGVSPLRPLKR